MINIGDSIRIQVIGVRGKQVRIGIEAPGDLLIHRNEVYEKIRQANVSAAKDIITERLKPLSDLFKEKENDKPPK